MKLLFLDIDGVLNGHKQFANGYTTIEPHGREHLNIILEKCPEVQLVISSAWRYHVHNGSMTLRGLEEMLLTHGLNVRGRIHGITDPDPVEFQEGHWTDKSREWWHEQGIKWRRQQIWNYLSRIEDVLKVVIVDDIPLEIDDLVQVTSASGMNELNAIEIIERFGVEIPGIGKCMECALRLPLRDYNGHGHLVCRICYERLSEAFDEGYR